MTAAAIATRDGWTVERLSDLRDARLEGLDLIRCAHRFAVEPRAVDIALNSLTGRTPTEAFVALLGRETGLTAAVPRLIRSAVDASGFHLAAARPSDRGDLTLKLQPWTSDR